MKTGEIDDREIGSPSPLTEGSSGNDDPSGHSTVSVEVLRLGMRLSRDIYDQEGVLLLAAGSQITSRFLQLLSQRNIKTVRLEGRPAVPRVDRAGRVEQQLCEELGKSRLSGVSQSTRDRPLKTEDLLNEAKSGLSQHKQMGELFAEVGSSLQKGRTIPGDKVLGATNNLVNMLTLDCDLLSMIVGLQQTQGGEYLFDHAVNCAMMSMTVAGQLGASTEQLVHIGVGAMLQDVGMLKVPDSIRFAKRKLDSFELGEVRRHPIHSLDMLENVQGLSSASKFIAFQVHERENGSGYPRKRTSMTIHSYAKLVGFVDAFAAMTRPRPYREAIPPHMAVKEILQKGAAGVFDRRMLRAFLDCVSVFPIGSAVGLKKGIVGLVVRANPGAHARPVIMELDESGEATGWEIDLAKEKRLKVVSAGATLKSLT